MTIKELENLSKPELLVLCEDLALHEIFEQAKKIPQFGIWFGLCLGYSNAFFVLPTEEGIWLTFGVWFLACVIDVLYCRFHNQKLRLKINSFKQKGSVLRENLRSAGNSPAS